MNKQTAINKHKVKNIDLFDLIILLLHIYKDVDKQTIKIMIFSVIQLKKNLKIKKYNKMEFNNVFNDLIINYLIGKTLDRCSNKYTLLEEGKKYSEQLISKHLKYYKQLHNLVRKYLRNESTCKI